MSQSAKSVKRGPFGLFKHPFCCKKIEQNEGGPFGDIKKSHNAEKTKGDPLVVSGFVCYAKKTTSIVQFPGPNGTYWRPRILWNLK